jgi:hypothetical protein
MGEFVDFCNPDHQITGLDCGLTGQPFVGLEPFLISV